jgi:sigma-B regulation protein RsbU (phosphoserine phosphatase)
MEDYELAAEYHPAREVGGDLYDFELSASRDVLQLVIGDVSGKSIPAALYGAVFSGHVRTLFAQNLQPGEALQVLNARLIQRYHMQNFISVAQMRLDLKSGNARLANSGVPYPCLVHNGKITQLTASGVPLGFFDEAEYVDLQFYMQPGDLAILATDGLIDALDPDGRMFDEDRYLESVLRHAHQPVAQCLRNICEDVLRFAQNAALHDDITLLALRRR